MFISVNKSNPARLGLIIPIIDSMITASNGNTISKSCKFLQHCLEIQ
ncbi:hypothetical protein BD31_I1696 [Candidatus Nitrosopumilus salaria BD31]|uniref:Uncharacterized protein n=1 Tax=Candidatus Nitrosopumilus salarius BD31 TaxID=859350 RepID=I3D391_9ARCH|nr:hypothetical protein BD31_I1696 [Candidatus Nitrosopumilus salaria BD31]